MPNLGSELAARLALQAEVVCRHYLFNGHRQGRYWIVGNVRNAPGRSMFVRLTGPESGPGAAGRWSDAASLEYGDLLDVIRANRSLVDFREVADEARRFLMSSAPLPDKPWAPVRVVSAEAARRLIAMSQPIVGTLVEAYLGNRGIKPVHAGDAIGFHPRCFYRHADGSRVETWPAMIAAVTDLAGSITGAHRTWLARDGSGKASVDTPRRAMGTLVGNAVRFGSAADVVAVGEGIETMLSLRCVLPAMPMAAALSAGHLATFRLSPALHRLYIAHDADPAGVSALVILSQRARAAGIEPKALTPRMGDFNDDLRLFGREALQAALCAQLLPEDRWLLAENGTTSAFGLPRLSR